MKNEITNVEKIKLVLDYKNAIAATTRVLYAIMPWSYLTSFAAVMEFVTNDSIKSIFETGVERIEYETDKYETENFLKDLLSKEESVRNMLKDAIKDEKINPKTIKRLKKLEKMVQRKASLNNFAFYTELYISNNKSYEELKNRFRNDGDKRLLKKQFLSYIYYMDIEKKKQSKKYTVSRDLDKDMYYETTEGRIAKIKRYLYKKYMKKGMIDINFKATTVINEGVFVKPMRLINKTIPKASENMKMLIASLFEGIKECKMIIDTDFKKAYDPYYNNHQDTDGDKASNYSCMSGEGTRAQNFYGLIDGCKVVRWETKDGEQIGRCIMYEWEGKRHFIRIYGMYDYHRTMINMLEAQMKEGDIFGRNKAIENIKLPTKMDGDTNVMYLDGNYYGLREEDGNWYMVAKGWNTDAKTTSGDSLESLVEDTSECEECGRRVLNDDGWWVCDRFFCCEECANNAGYYRCEICDEWEHTDNGIWIDDEFYCCEQCARKKGYEYCENCGKWHNESDGIWINDTFYCCEECAEEAGYRFDDYYNEWGNKDYLADTEDGEYCTTKSGAASHYNVEEDEIELDEEHDCWKVKEQEEETQGE